MGGEGVRLRTTTSVSQPRCLLKGGSGHVPRRVFVVALVNGDGIVMVSFCDEIRTIDGSRGMERVRDVTINANSGMLCGTIFDE